MRRESATLMEAPQTGHETISSVDAPSISNMFPHCLHLMLCSALSGSLGYSLLSSFFICVLLPSQSGSHSPDRRFPFPGAPVAIAPTPSRKGTSACFHGTRDDRRNDVPLWSSERGPNAVQARSQRGLSSDTSPCPGVYTRSALCHAGMHGLHAARTTTAVPAAISVFPMNAWLTRPAPAAAAWGWDEPWERVSRPLRWRQLGTGEESGDRRTLR